MPNDHLKVSILNTCKLNIAKSNKIIDTHRHSPILLNKMSISCIQNLQLRKILYIFHGVNLRIKEKKRKDPHVKLENGSNRRRNK